MTCSPRGNLAIIGRFEHSILKSKVTDTSRLVMKYFVDWFVVEELGSAIPSSEYSVLC